MVKKDASRILFRIISLFGTPFFYIPAIFYLLKINPRLAINVIIALVLTEVTCAFIKYVYPKERPIPMPRKTLFQKYLAGSFPSVHTARITALSAAAALFYANRRFILIASLVVIAVGYSRIYLKKHYLVDVIAGFLIGASIGILVPVMQNNFIH